MTKDFITTTSYPYFHEAHRYAQNFISKKEAHDQKVRTRSGRHLYDVNRSNGSEERGITLGHPLAKPLGGALRDMDEVNGKCPICKVHACVDMIS